MFTKTSNWWYQLAMLTSQARGAESFLSARGANLGAPRPTLQTASRPSTAAQLGPFDSWPASRTGSPIAVTAVSHFLAAPVARAGSALRAAVRHASAGPVPSNQCPRRAVNPARRHSREVRRAAARPGPRATQPPAPFPFCSCAAAATPSPATIWSPGPSTRRRIPAQQAWGGPAHSGAPPARRARVAPRAAGGGVRRFATSHCSAAAVGRVGARG